MLKFAFAIGISLEWLTGPAVQSAPALGHAALRAWMLALAAWIALEFVRMVVRAVQTLDG
jgi:hypothetical protein